MLFLRKYLVALTLAIAAGVALITAITFWLQSARDARQAYTPLAHMTVALPNLVSCGAFYVAMDQGMFEQHGLKVTVTPFAMGKLALEAVKRGNADVGVMADTAFMFSVMHGDNLATLGTVFGSRRNIAVVAHKDSGIITAHDLIGKTVATVSGTNNQYFLDALLVANNVDRSSVNIIYLKPDELVPMLQNRKIDAATLWHPTFFKAQKAINSPLTRIYGDDIFVFRFLLGGKSDYLAEHTIETRKLLAALDEANQFIHAHPEKAKAIIGKAIGLDASLLANDFDPTNFTLTLDQTLLLALDEQTRWATKRNLLPMSPTPNYIEFMRPALLESVRADAVKIIN